MDMSHLKNKVRKVRKGKVVWEKSNKINNLLIN